MERLWKVIGLATLGGVAATGAVLARQERERREYTPEEIRARLHARAGVAPTATAAPAAMGDDAPAQPPRAEAEPPPEAGS